MAVPTVLSHASTGAPALTGEDGSLYEIFKWALPQLGWAVAYDEPGEFRVALRNDPVAGTGYYLKIWDDSSDHAGTARHARAQVFLDMTGIDAGIDPAFSVQRFIAKSPALSSTTRHWYIIGDAQRFYFLRDADGTTNRGGGFNCYHFGDFNPFFPQDPGPYFCPLSSSSGFGTQDPAWALSAVSVSDALTPTDASTASRTDYQESLPVLFNGSGSGTARLRSFAGASSGAPNMGDNGGTQLAPSNPASRVFVAEGNLLRGELVGALNPLQSRPFGSGSQLVPGVHNGREPVDVMYFNMTMFFNENNPNRGSIYIDVSSDWSDW